MDHEYDILGGYIPSFVQHLKDTGARLGLRVGSQVDGDETSRDGAIEEATEAHAPSRWTSAEHDVFFRALSVHSRWRPDLIAACIPTRTEWEVWMYLAELEEGSFGDECGDMGMHVDRSHPDSLSHCGSDTDEDGYLYEPALEVSQAWIDVEERMASWVVHREDPASVANNVPEDMEDKLRKRKRGRPRGAGKGRAQSRVRRRAVSNEGYCSPFVLRSPSSESTSASARGREILMGHLKVPHLLVLDSILREGEEMMKEKSKGRQGSVTTSTPTDHGEEGVPRVGDVEVPTLSELQGTSNAPQSPPDMTIDPVLLALSRGADLVGRPSGRIPSECTLANCVSERLPVQGPSSLPNASSHSTSLETFLLDNVTLTRPGPAANVEPDLSLFSPRSRRRIHKRLYMRRKRALLRENGVALEDTVCARIDRLKPGKKGKSEQSEVPTVSTSVPCSEVPSDAEMEIPENMSKKNKPSLTLLDKLKSQFVESGIDAAYLRCEGMDLLNLNALGKLMGLCSSLEHGEEEADGPVQSIDAQLIRHLQAAMVAFMTDIIHRVVVWREREIRLKQRSRAWRHGDQITIGAVEHAVEAVGARYRSHKEYFRSLGVLHGLSTGPSVPANASEERGPTKESVDPDVEVFQLPGSSHHRDVYTPLIHPPSAWRMGPLACLTQTYEREAKRTRRGTSADVEEEELMSNETDEEALEEELREEDEGDVRDMELAATEEERLWDAIRY